MKKIIFKSKLWQHQIKNLKFHLELDKSGDWSDCGVGKSVIALKKCQMYYNAGLAQRILIVCPLSVVTTWILEIETHTTFTFVPLTGSLVNKVDMLRSTDYDIYIISYDSIPGRRNKKTNTYGILLSELAKKEFDFLIADEVTMITGFRTLRTKAITLLSERTPYVMFMSGTPVTNHPSSILALYRALDWKVFGKNYYATRNKYFKDEGWRFPDWKLRQEKKEEFIEKLYSIATRVRKEDCLDLPEKVFSPRFAYLSPEQAKFYAPIAAQLVKELEIPEGRIKIHNILTAMAKLSQITSGFIYTDNEPHIFKRNPKLEILDQVLESIPTDKIIVYSRWLQDLDTIEKHLTEMGIYYVRLDGSTPSHTRTEYVQAFQNESDIRIFLSNLSVGGFGLTLTAAATIIYYSLEFGVVNFLQSQDRIHRISQNRTCLYIPIMVDKSIDTYIYNSLQNKVDVADSILNHPLRLRLVANLRGM